MGKRHELTVPGRFDRIGEICEFVAVGAREAGFDPDEVFRIELACDEACTNIIQHAYGGEDGGDIHVVWLLSEDAFRITMHDDGRPFDPDEIPPPNVPQDPDDVDQLKIGGLGIHFMRKLMDEVKFHIEGATGNKLTMIKYLPGRD